MNKNILSQALINNETYVSCFALVSSISVIKQRKYRSLTLKGDKGKTFRANTNVLDLKNIRVGSPVLIEGMVVLDHHNVRIISIKSFRLVEEQSEIDLVYSHIKIDYYLDKLNSLAQEKRHSLFRGVASSNMFSSDPDLYYTYKECYNLAMKSFEELDEKCKLCRRCMS